MKNKTTKILMFVFLGLFVVGVFLLALSFIQNTDNSVKFLYVSMSIIGFMGFALCMTGYIYKKKFKNKNEIVTSLEEGAVPFFVNKEKKPKKKKFVCQNCKYKYEEDMPRCPKCGAPPNF